MQAINDKCYVWFQCTDMQRILSTNEFLFKIEIYRSEACAVCVENIVR